MVEAQQALAGAENIASGPLTTTSATLLQITSVSFPIKWDSPIAFDHSDFRRMTNSTTHLETLLRCRRIGQSSILRISWGFGEMTDKAFRTVGDMKETGKKGPRTR